MKKTICILGVIIISLAFVGSFMWKKAQGDLSNLIVHEEQIEIPGLQKSFEFIFVADTHVALCDDRDADFRDYMNSRYEMFRNQNGEGSELSFKNIISYVSKEKPDLLVLGGDIVDAASWACVDYMKEMLKKVKCPWIYSMGNHDFNYGAQEYFSEKAYKEYLPRFKEISQTADGFQYIEYDEFIVFAVDDKNNQIPVGAVEGLKNMCNKNKPIVLITHVPIEPLEENTLHEETIQVWGADENGYSKVLMGEHSKRPNEDTKQFLELILDKKSPVCLVLSGHIHFYHKDILNGDLLQIVTGPGFQQELIKVKLIPEE